MNILNKIPAWLRKDVAWAAGLWVVTFGTTLANLGTSGLSLGAILGAASGAAVVVLRRLFPEVPVATK